VSATMTDQGVNIYVEMPPSPDLWKPMNLTFVDESMAQKPSPPADTTVGIIRNSKEPKKPSLACTFCRERKIACGRPAEGSIDPTCKYVVITFLHIINANCVWGVSANVHAVHLHASISPMITHDIRDGHESSKVLGVSSFCVCSISICHFVVVHAMSDHNVFLLSLVVHKS
jgi:hypothetical protein